ncbi:MAG TPA: class I SAM-dependent methyltransferase [Nocardia sp.]|uniref:class I SAM-dependent methyltransferase n=1 Tax=Nocardia sp. TaxID=1821 RepID=UPI002B4AC31F|nr:class I SAM-dependent methyltransferase [Nocardia sp.]HLS75934.1 class I SAM-dependent methyltransferase [Nocardia sp.]
MGWYDEHVVPRLVDFVCGMQANDRYRARACEGLRGRVVEIGFGSGLNVPFYPSAVESVSAVEPSDKGWSMAAERVAASRVPVERSGLDGAALPFDDSSFDTALSTFTMCTIPDIEGALAQVRRVLAPGGTLHFVEHGLAPDPKVRAWQHRLNPIERAVAGGCNLDRDIPGLLAANGFRVTELDRFYAPGPKFLTALSIGVATAA